MKVQAKHGKVTQNMHGASRNYRYVWDVSIECNPEKIAAIKRMGKPRNLKDVQKFNGCLASLSRFLSRLGEKAIPLYQLMKKTYKFSWTPQADEEFKHLKCMMSTAPVLAAPVEKEPMM